jgi:hypothetical protein
MGAPDAQPSPKEGAQAIDCSDPEQVRRRLIGRYARRFRRRFSGSPFRGAIGSRGARRSKKLPERGSESERSISMFGYLLPLSGMRALESSSRVILNLLWTVIDSSDACASSFVHACCLRLHQWMSSSVPVQTRTMQRSMHWKQISQAS